MIFKKYPFVHQRENKDCGVSCLSMIIKYYDGCISEDTLYEITKTTKKGTNAYNLIEAAKALGFKAAGIKCNIEKLNCSLPCIAHVLVNKSYGHYVVIYRIDKRKKELYIGDPAKKKMKISFDKFNSMFTGIIITLTLEKKLPKYENNITLKKYITNMLVMYKKDYIRLFIQSIFLLSISIIFSLALVIMLYGVEIDSKNLIINVFIIFIFIGIIKNIINYTQNKLVCKIQCKVNNHLMIQAIKNIILLPYQFYCNRSTGEITKRLQDLENVGRSISKLLLLICMDSLIAITSGYLLYKLNFNLFKISIVWIFIYVLIVYIFKNLLKEKIGILKQQSSSLYNNLIESIKGFETIKGLQLEDKIINNLSKDYINYNNELYRFELISEKQKFLKSIISDIGYLFLYGISSLQIVNGHMTMTEVIAFQTLLAYFLSPIEQFMEINISIYDMEKSLQRGLDIIYHDNSKGDLNCNQITKIELKNVSYEKNDIFLKNISLKIIKGEKVLLMGNSGSGKSTLLKIIRGYYQPSKGNVYINDLESKSYDKNSVGKRITYLAQNEILFTNTLYNNIKLDRSLRKNEIVKQIKINHIDKIISNKTIGLQEIIEENGNNLSGGERQRIILARTLLKKSDVLLIDEGFSQMDSNLERSILKNIFKTYLDKTIIIVSHRKDNIDLFDTYIELENGRINKYLKKVPTKNGGKYVSHFY